MVTLDLQSVLGDRGQRDRLLRTHTLLAMSVARREQLATASEHPDHEDWLDFAERNRVGPIVAHALLDMGVTGATHQRATAIHEASAARMRVLMDQMDLVADRLAEVGIPLVALKNAGIARGIFSCPACCPMGDIDTLIERDRFREAHRLVEELGFKIATRAALVEEGTLEDGLESGGTEYIRSVGGEDVWLELQWRAVAGRWIRPDQEPQSSDLLARSVEIPGSSVRLLGPADNMIQVGLHTAKHSYVRAPGLRLHTDVDRLNAFATPDWTQVIDHATRLRIRTPVYFSLSLAQALLGSEIPSEVLDALAPARWKRELVGRWVRRVDVFEPNEKKFTRPGMMVFHGLLYDSLTGFTASVLDTEPEKLGLRHLPRNVRTGFKRVKDLATRYQR